MVLQTAWNTTYSFKCLQDLSDKKNRVSKKFKIFKKRAGARRDCTKISQSIVTGYISSWDITTYESKIKSDEECK